MDPIAPKNHSTSQQVQGSPVFFTGLSTSTMESVSPLLCKLCNANLSETGKSGNLCSDCKEMPPEFFTQISSVNTMGSMNVRPTFRKAIKRKCLLNTPTFNSDRLSDTVKSAIDSLKNTDIKVFEDLLQTTNHTQQVLKSESSWKERNEVRSRGAPYRTPGNNAEHKKFYSSPPPISRNVQFLAKANHDEILSEQTTSPVPNCLSTSPPKSYHKLSKEIWNFFHEKKQTGDLKEKKMILREKLHEILLTRFPNCALYVVGSSMTGLGASSSDMDMCLMLTHSEIDQQKEATRILRAVRNLFQKYKFLTNIELIYAKVPILKFKDSVSNVEVDLNINNAVGIRNTQLLSSYARIDPRLPPLIILAKLWARHNRINDAKNNSLSSYSIVLMVIHYLQYRCRPPVIPCLQMLQPDKFHPNSDVRNLIPNEELPFFHSENNLDLGDLFVGFLKYYADEFDYNQVMSVRLGTVIPKYMAMSNLSPNNKKAHWSLLGIEEPFDLTNTARAVFREYVFEKVLYVFRESWHSLRNNPVLHSLFS